MQETMRAAIITEPGDATSVRTVSLPVPAPGPGEVLVAFLASEVNRVDEFVRSGAYPTPLPSPFVIGRDLVGEVVATGSHITTYTAGDLVWTNSMGYDGRQGTFAEYSSVPEERLFPLPDGADPEAFASIIHGATTAVCGFERAAITQGDTVVIEGGSGAVGSACVQLARVRGAQVIVTAAPDDRDWVLGLGATTVLDYRDPYLYDTLHTHLGDGAQSWWDTSGHGDLGRALTLTAQGGSIIITAGLAEHSHASVDVTALYTRDLTMHGFAVSNASLKQLQHAGHTINDLYTRGGLRGRIAERIPLTQAHTAHTVREHQRKRGRIICIPTGAESPHPTQKGNTP